MADAIFLCPAAWEAWVSPETRRLRQAEELPERAWEILLLPPGTVREIHGTPVRCSCLLVEGDCRPELLASVETEHVVTYGLSPRDRRYPACRSLCCASSALCRGRTEL